jgi:hypothetical protein
MKRNNILIFVGIGLLLLCVLWKYSQREEFEQDLDMDRAEHPHEELVDGTVWANPQYAQAGLGWVN